MSMLKMSLKKKKEFTKTIKSLLRENQGIIPQAALNALLHEMPGGRAVDAVFKEIERQKRHQRHQKNVRNLSAFIVLTAAGYAGYRLLKNKYKEKKALSSLAAEEDFPELEKDISLNSAADGLHLSSGVSDGVKSVGKD